MASIFGDTPKRVAVNYDAHLGQIEVIEAISQNFISRPLEEQATIIEIIASRGWGKTLFMAAQILVPWLNDHANEKVMWVAPTYQIAMAPIDDVFKGINETTGERWIPDKDEDGNKIWEFSNSASGPVLKWYNGATVAFKSADSPDSIVSRGYNLIVIDEAAVIDERVFTQQIMGTARKHGIKIFMISSPRGKKHWTYKYFLKGQDLKESQYLSFQQPYTKNPHFSPVLTQLIKDLPEWIVRQEYLAEFIDDGDSVFKGLANCIAGPEISFTSQQQEWQVPSITDIRVQGIQGEFFRRAGERRFVIGMDLAKSHDYTVMYVMDIDNGECVYYRRLNKMPYTDMADLVVRVSRQFNGAELIYDATGVGSAFGDILTGKDINAHPYVFSNDSKSDLVNRLAIAIEYKEITIPNITTVRNELEAFTYTITRTGKFSYNAPAGFHDDTVVALALANWFRRENSTSESLGIIDAVINHNLGAGNRRRSFLAEMEDDDD